MSNPRKMENPMGAGKKPALRVAFDSRLKLEFHRSKVTSDAGLLAYRELDAALGLTDLGEDLLRDWRMGKNTQHSMVALMRQSIFSRLAGYEDTVPNSSSKYASKFDLLTYRKGHGPCMPRKCFHAWRTRRDGRIVTYVLAVREVRLLKGRLRLRQVTRLTDDGHQTPLLTSRRDLSAAQVAYRTFERWRQETFFPGSRLRLRYAMQEAF
jgi:hypothetical protein